MTETRRQPLRTLISLVTGAYALGLLIFVLLRLIWGNSLWWLALFGNFTPVYFAALIVLLPLALLFRAKRGALLMLPLVLVGAVWFGRLYLPKTTVNAGDAATLKVISFNVWGDNPNLTPAEDWLRDQAADVVVTVELPPVWNDGRSGAARRLPGADYRDFGDVLILGRDAAHAAPDCLVGSDRTGRRSHAPAARRDRRGRAANRRLRDPFAAAASAMSRTSRSVAIFTARSSRCTTTVRGTLRSTR